MKAPQSKTMRNVEDGGMLSVRAVLSRFQAIRHKEAVLGNGISQRGLR